MKNATQSNYVHKKVVVFPDKFSSTGADMPAPISRARAQFEHLLIFVLFSMWAVGVVAWTLISLVGFGHGPAQMGYESNPFTSPTVLPTVQSATIFAARMVLGF